MNVGVVSSVLLCFSDWNERREEGSIQKFSVDVDTVKEWLVLRSRKVRAGRKVSVASIL